MLRHPPIKRKTPEPTTIRYNRLRKKLSKSLGHTEEFRPTRRTTTIRQIIEKSLTLYFWKTDVDKVNRNEEEKESRIKGVQALHIT